MLCKLFVEHCMLFRLVWVGKRDRDGQTHPNRNQKMQKPKSAESQERPERSQNNNKQGSPKSFLCSHNYNLVPIIIICIHTTPLPCKTNPLLSYPKPPTLTFLKRKLLITCENNLKILFESSLKLKFKIFFKK